MRVVKNDAVATTLDTILDYVLEVRTEVRGRVEWICVGFDTVSLKNATVLSEGGHGQQASSHLHGS